MFCLICHVTAVPNDSVFDGDPLNGNLVVPSPTLISVYDDSGSSTLVVFCNGTFMENHEVFAEGRGVDSSPLCLFAAGEGETVTVDNQMGVREISARMGIGGTNIPDNPDAPLNLRYTFDATAQAADQKNNFATGGALVYSEIDMLHSDDNISDLNHTPPNISDHLKDRQEQFGAASPASDPMGTLATGSGVIYSNVDMHTFGDTSDLHNQKPSITGHFQDKQEQRVRGLFDLSTTFEYTA